MLLQQDLLQRVVFFLKSRDRNTLMFFGQIFSEPVFHFLQAFIGNVFLLSIVDFNVECLGKEFNSFLVTFEAIMFLQVGHYKEAELALKFILNQVIDEDGFLLVNISSIPVVLQPGIRKMNLDG